MKKKAKIVATIGPSSDNPETLRKIIESGLDVARLNFSHGTHEEHKKRIETIRQIADKAGKPITILQDLQGPKLRVGNLPKDGIQLSAGQKVMLTSCKKASVSKDITMIPMDVPDLEKSVDVGNKILMDDGNLELEVLNIDDDSLTAEVIIGGVLKSHKGVNLPGAKLNIPCFTEKDQRDLVFGLDQDIDAIAISFVCEASDISTVKNAIIEHAPSKSDTPVIAKLERPEAITNLESIIKIADGVMVARGDLGVETSPASVPIIQKRIIDTANQYNKLVITATQMLDSMIHNPRPTRAEASDVANAIFDGTDAVMLSGETASGKYPVESVKMMNDIIIEAEKDFDKWGTAISWDKATKDDALSITYAAHSLAHDLNVAGIAVLTMSGRTAALMSKTRPRVPIMAFTPSLNTYKRLGMYWGVIPFLVPFSSELESLLQYVEAALLSHTTFAPEQQVVIISSFPVGDLQPPNFAMLHTLGKNH